MVFVFTAVIGLKSEYSTLVIPKVDDCIGILLGSNDEYKTQQLQQPGTYYLTKGWLKTKNTPLDDVRITSHTIRE